MDRATGVVGAGNSAQRVASTEAAVVGPGAACVGFSEADSRADARFHAGLSAGGKGAPTVEQTL